MTRAKYVVVRFGRRNPVVDGKKLYLTDAGFWTLNLVNARRFGSKAAARQLARQVFEAWAEAVAP